MLFVRIKIAIDRGKTIKRRFVLAPFYSKRGKSILASLFSLKFRDSRSAAAEEKTFAGAHRVENQ